ncbi:MAG: HAMP domain-containing histidine kinase [Clostridia bacterium]|nr:HAMP domain-containing histidine kinase [Clostridia bacterium]
MRKRRRRRHSISLRAKYTIMLASIIIACFLLLGIALVAFAGRYWRDQKVDLLTENTHNVAQSASELLSGGYISMYGDGDSVAALGSSLSLISTSIDADVFICDTTGHIIMCRDFLVDGTPVANACEYHDNFVVPEEIIDEVFMDPYSTVITLDEVSVFDDNTDNKLDESHFIVGEPVMVEGHTVALVFAVAPEKEAMLSFVTPIVQLIAVALFAVMLFAIMAIYIASHIMTKPLKDMAAVTKSYGEGDFSPRIRIKRKDEIGQLASSINAMARSLAQLESSRRSFVANVSHELKTPMTTISGFIDGILDETIPPEQQEYYLRIVSEEVKRLSRIVVSMLNLSKIEAGQLDLSISDVDLSDIILNTFLNLEQKISNGSIEVRGLDNLSKHFVRADKDMLGQVVYNLVDNAVKFTPEQGYIAVRVIENEDSTEVHILNSGTGVATDELQKIFERFYKVDKSRSADAKSTGLGLYIVKSILELHNGKIYAESVEGRYTEFVFTLPK